MAIAPPFRVERFVVLICAHFYDRQALGDDVCRQRCRQIVDLPGPVESQGYPLNRIVRLAEDAYFQ